MRLYKILESAAHLGGHGWIETNQVEAKSGAAAIRMHRAGQRRWGNVSFQGTKFKAVLMEQDRRGRGGQAQNKQNGIDRLKRNPNRLMPATIIVRGKRVSGKAKYDSKAKRVRVFVAPNVARKVNRNPGLKIVPVTKERYESEVRPRLRSPYNLLPFAIWKHSKSGKGMKLLYRGSDVLKAGTAGELRRFVRTV